MKNIFICLTFDTDPDISFNANQIDSKNKKIVGWKGLEIGKNLIYNSIKKIERKYKIKIPQSWFVRVDDQIKFYQDLGYNFVIKKVGSDESKEGMTLEEFIVWLGVI